MRVVTMINLGYYMRFRIAAIDHRVCTKIGVKP